MVDTTGRVYGPTVNNGSNILFGTTTYGDAYNPNVVISSTSVTNDGYTVTSVAQNFVATFSEIDIVNFVITDITVANGTKSNFAGPTTVNGVDVFTFDVTPTGQGLVQVSIGSGVANDFAGNPNNASNTYTFTYDSVAPTVTLTSGSVANDGYTNSATQTINVAFTEAGSGINNSSFTLSDITIVNGVASSLTGSGNSWSFVVTPSGQGQVQVSISTNKVLDNAGNNNTASNTYQYVYDSISPVVINVTSSTTDGYYNAPDLVTVQVTFDEIVHVTGVPQLTLETGGIDTVIDYSSGSGSNTLIFLYTVALEQNSSDLDYVSTSALALNGGSIKDAVLNNANLTLPIPGTFGSLGFNKNIVVDTIQPSVTITSSTVLNGDSTNINPILFTATFSEPVTWISPEDITTSSGMIQNFVIVSPTITTFELASPTFGVTTVDIDAGKVIDSAGNTNTASPQFIFTTIGFASGNLSGVRGNETWVGTVVLTGNAIIPSGVTVVINLDCAVHTYGYTIIVQDGGILDTQGKRLPRKSSINSRIIVT